MAKNWKVMKIADAVKGKDFGVFRAADVAGLTSPIERDEAPCMLANCSASDARRYVRELESGIPLETVRFQRQCIRNMVHSGMN